MSTTSENQDLSNQDLTIYKSEDGEISFNVNVFEETVWLTQNQMALLFDKDRKTITEHIRNIYKEKELENNRKVLRNVEHYNLDVIISVGYRVKSKRGTQFRRWATNILKQYLLNGYAINEQRIKNIEDKVQDLSDEIKEIHKFLIQIANRPITINNNFNLISEKLENQIIELGTVNKGFKF